MFAEQVLFPGLIVFRIVFLMQEGTVTAPESLRIVEAREQDISLILHFIRELARYEKLVNCVENDENLLRRILFRENRDIHAVIAYEDAVPVGFAVFFYTYSTFVGRRGLHLEDLFVKPEARGKGFGRALLSYLAKRAKADGCWRIEWAVLNWNEPAISFYQALGAVPMNEWTTYRLFGPALDSLAED